MWFAKKILENSPVLPPGPDSGFQGPYRLIRFSEPHQFQSDDLFLASSLNSVIFLTPMSCKRNLTTLFSFILSGVTT